MSLKTREEIIAMIQQRIDAGSRYSQEPEWLGPAMLILLQLPPREQLDQSGDVTSALRADLIAGIRQAVVSLSPWSHHHRSCARAESTGNKCDCGLQEQLINVLGEP